MFLKNELVTVQRFNKHEVHLQENNSKRHVKIHLIYCEILAKPSLLPAPKTRCGPVALLKCIF